jgi:hypothetical protein
MVLGSGPGSAVAGVPGASGGVQAIGGEPPRRSGTALASLIFGLFFFVFPASIAAIVFGHLSLSEIRKSAGRISGHGMAMAGLILGYVGVAIIPFILIVAAIAIPHFLVSKIARNEATAVDALHQIRTATNTYATTYGHGYPTRMDALGPPAADEAPRVGAAALLDAELAGGTRGGYIFVYLPAHSQDGSVQAFSVRASPIRPGQTGRRFFFMDSTGSIHWALTGPANADSPSLQ